MKNICGKIDSKSKVRETLIRIGAINPENVMLFSEGTRDCKQLNVFRDRVTKVIFIDDYYVGDGEYRNGNYRRAINQIDKSGNVNLEDIFDTERRYMKYRQFIVDKDICDFGCGAGNFLKISKSSAKSVVGVELQQSYSDELNNLNIPCHSSLKNITYPLDFISLFHCFEHLPDPTAVLCELRASLKTAGQGVLLIEVPHARDFLIDQLSVKSFIDFTLWSQHLVLHTRESLRLFLTDAGFKNIIIEGVQRYNLSNHLQWISKNKPGGHKSELSIFQTQQLTDAYADSLLKIDATDTLVALATL